MFNNLVDNAYKWLNLQIKADKSRRKSIDIDGTEIHCAGIFTEKEIQMHGLKPLADLLEIENFKADWSGNKANNTHYDIIWFVYNNYKFFELVNKE